MKTSTKLTLIALLWLIVINAGNLGVLDTELRLQMAHAWWTGTEEVQVSPTLKPIVRGDIRFGVMGVGDKRYLAYEEGQSLLMLPGDWIGEQIHHKFPIMTSEDWRMLAVSFLIFIPLNLAVVVSCFWLLRLFNFEEGIAGLTSLFFLLGTTALHYAQVHQHNNQVLLCVIIGYAAALAYVLRGRSYFAVISGLAIGGTILLRISSLIHVLTVFVFFLGCVIYNHPNRRKILSAIALWIMGFIPLTLLGRIFDYIRYGSLMATGKKVEQLQLAIDPTWNGLPQFPPEYPLINSPDVGIIGPFLSPAKSIFIYDPFLLPCIIIAIIFWKRFSPYLQWYIVTVNFNLVFHLVAYSRFFFWHGDNAWASRYHVTSVQLLIIPLLGVFIKTLISAKGLKKWIMQSIIVLAIIVQIASVAMPFNLEIYQRAMGIPGTRSDFRLGRRMINIACQLNPSISRNCIADDPDKQAQIEGFNHFSFFPFTLMQKATENPSVNSLVPIVFYLWGFFLIMAMSLTVWFCYSP